MQPTAVQLIVKKDRESCYIWKQLTRDKKPQFLKSKFFSIIFSGPLKIPKSYSTLIRPFFQNSVDRLRGQYYFLIISVPRETSGVLPL